jgi:hypothetical protein
MKYKVRAANHHQRQGDVNNPVTPEMRQQIRELKYELDECDYNLSRHLGLFNGIRETLDTARLSARCLLTRDPFETWEKVAKQREEERAAICDTSSLEIKDNGSTVKASAGVEKLITRQMRQQIIEAKKRLENYANCLNEFFADVTKVKSLDTVIKLSDDLQYSEPLETAEARKRREEQRQTSNSADLIDWFAML